MTLTFQVVGAGVLWAVAIAICGITLEQKAADALSVNNEGVSLSVSCRDQGPPNVTQIMKVRV